MNQSKISQIRKRDGSIVSFNPDKIEQAVYKALSAGHRRGSIDDPGLEVQTVSCR